jgi:hypothetical protein
MHTNHRNISASFIAAASAAAAITTFVVMFASVHVSISYASSNSAFSILRSVIFSSALDSTKTL